MQKRISGKQRIGNCKWSTSVPWKLSILSYIWIVSRLFQYFFKAFSRHYFSARTSWADDAVVMRSINQFFLVFWLPIGFEREMNCITWPNFLLQKFPVIKKNRKKCQPTCGPGEKPRAAWLSWCFPGSMLSQAEGSLAVIELVRRGGAPSVENILLVVLIWANSTAGESGVVLAR